MLPTEIADLLLSSEGYSFSVSSEKKDLLPHCSVIINNNKTHAQKSCWAEQGH